MRTTTAAQLAMLALEQRATRARVKVYRAGTWENLSDLSGWDFLVSGAIAENADSPCRTLKLKLKRQNMDLNLSPLMAGSKLNDPGVLVNIAVGILVEFAVMPIDTEPESGDWVEVFRGVIDVVDPAKDTLSVDARDLGGDLMDWFAETQRVYGSAAGARLELEMQKILDDYNPHLETVAADFEWDGTTTVDATDLDTSELAVNDYFGYLNAPMFKIIAINPNVDVTISNPHNETIPTGTGAGSSIMIPGAYRRTLYSVNGSAADPLRYNAGGWNDSPGWMVKEWKQAKDHILPSLRKLAQQIGWECKYQWQSNVGAYSLVFYEPDRAKATPDHTFDDTEYFEFTKLAISRAKIRNAVRVTYGAADNRTSVLRTNAASITKYGRRYMEIAESSSSQIDQLAEAQAMADAALADLKEPTAELAVSLPLFWPVEIADLIRWTENGHHFDSDQDLAVVALSHAFGDKSYSQLTLRGTPSAGSRRWLEMEGRPGVAPATDHYTDEAAGSVAATAGVGSLEITYDDPRTMTPPILDWLMTEVYAVASDYGGAYPDFTPGSTNLVARGKQTTFEITGLRPGVEYAIKLIIIDASGNVGTATTAVQQATERVGPYHNNNETEWGVVNPNSNFGIYTRDDTTYPMDHWLEYSGSYGDWGTGEGDWYFSTTIQQTGARSLKMFAMTAIAGDRFSTFESDFVLVESGMLYLLEFLWQHDGDDDNKVLWAPHIDWYTSAQVYISSSDLDDTWLSYNDAAVGLACANATWFRDRGWATAPATAKYAKIRLRVNANTNFLLGGQTKHPAMYFDFVALSRDLAKMIQNNGNQDRAINSGAWTRPYFGQAPTLDNTNGFTSGVPAPPVEHSYTIPYDGEYSVYAKAHFIGLAVGDDMCVKVQCNAADLIVGDETTYQGQGNMSTSVSEVVQLSAGDTLDVYCIHNNGVAKTIDDSESRFTVIQTKNNYT